MSIKIKFPQKELKRRVAHLLNINISRVLNVSPTLSGKSFLALITDNSWTKKQYTKTFTVWEIVESLPLDDIQADMGINILDVVMELRQHLRTLGLMQYPKNLEDLKVVYRQKAKESHPDHGGNAEVFREVQFAYETLKKHHGTFFAQN